MDTGNFTGLPTPEGTVKTGALLEAMERMGYGPVNVGERDVRQGYAEFAELTADSKLTFVSANLVRQDDQRPVFEPHAVVELGQGDDAVRVGVIGVMRYNPLFLKAGPGETSMVVAHPEERVRAEVAALQDEDVDAIVLLAAMHQNDARRLVSEIPEIDFVFGAYGGVFQNSPLIEENATIMYCGNKGQRVGEVRVVLGDDGATAGQHSKMHFLNTTYPADQEMLDFVNSVPVKPEAGTPERRSTLPAGGADGGVAPPAAGR